VSSLQVLPQKSPDERLIIPFNFVSEFSSGQTITGAQVTASVWAGTDTAPSAIISGTPTFGNGIVFQAFIGGVAGNIYKIEVIAAGSDASSAVIYGYLAVVADPL
jgi:hypothetical protein